MGVLLAAAKDLGGDYDTRSRALARIAFRFVPKQESEALRAAKAISDVSARSKFLVAMTLDPATNEKDKELCEVLDMVKATLNVDQRSKALAATLGFFPNPLRVRGLFALIDTVRDVPRKEALSAARAAAAPTFEFGGRAAVIEVGRAIQDICSWYP